MTTRLARFSAIFERFAKRLSRIQICLLALLFLVVESALRLTVPGCDLNIVGLAGGCFIGLVLCRRRSSR